MTINTIFRILARKNLTGNLIGYNFSLRTQNIINKATREIRNESAIPKRPYAGVRNINSET